MKGLVMLRFILSVMVAVVSVVSAEAQTPFPARFVDAGQTVVVPKGDYLISRETIVRGGTLIIEAGAKIKVQSIGRPIQVAGGVLEIRGTAADPVVIEPDVGHTCGHMVTYFAYGKRPQVSINYLDWQTTLNGTCMVLSATDFEIANSVILSAAAASLNRGCIQAGGGSRGLVADCLLECVKEGATSTSGVIIGNGTSQNDWVQVLNVTTVNCANPLNVKKNVATLNGVIE